MNEQTQERMRATRLAVGKALEDIRAGADASAHFWLGNAFAHCPTSVPEWPTPSVVALALRKLERGDTKTRHDIITHLKTMLRQLEELIDD